MLTSSTSHTPSSSSWTTRHLECAASPWGRVKAVDRQSASSSARGLCNGGGAEEALRAWAEGQGIDDTQLSPKPGHLGVRITFWASGHDTQCPTQSARRLEPVDDNGGYVHSSINC